LWTGVREIIEEHLAYISDKERLDCFKEAIGKIVRPGDLVADVGCGFGVLGLLCLRAGAAQVWGIDRTGAIEIARESMARAGLGDRYICIRETSQRVVLPELVDIIICDHVGYFGFDYGILPTFDDARRRFLKPGGKVAPTCIKPMLAAVQSADCRKKAEAWHADPVPLEFSWLREYGVNTMHAVQVKPEELLSAPATLGAIDLRVDSPDFLSFATDLSIVRQGVVDGLAGWFECELAEGVRMTNSPFAADAIARAQVFLPIGQRLDLKAGERLRVSVMARPTDGVFSWSVEVLSMARRFVHSTWKSMAMTKEDVGRSRPDRMLRLTPAGQARQIVLSYCDGRRTSREIEQAVLKDHSDLFPTREEISRFVLGELGRNTQ
jgi:protein arginine N-methyltransferase 1